MATEKRYSLPRYVEARIDRVRGDIPKEYRVSSDLKARVLAHLILKHNLKRAVEIGVYHGSSLLPQAVGQAYIGGVAIGIDPFSAIEAAQLENEELLEPVKDIVNRIDWEDLYRKVHVLISRHGLTNSCKILRMTADAAAQLVPPELDLIHIDGNHDRAKVLADLGTYVPKLRTGGFLVVDDIGWPTINPEYVKLRKRMKVIFEEKIQYVIETGWGVLQKL